MLILRRSCHFRKPITEEQREAIGRAIDAIIKPDGLTRGDIGSRPKPANLSHIRHICAYVAVCLTGDEVNYRDIASAVCRTRSSMHYAVASGRSLYQANKIYRQMVDCRIQVLPFDERQRIAAELHVDAMEYDEAMKNRKNSVNNILK